MTADPESLSAPPGLRAQVVRGMSWVLTGQIAMRVMALLTTVVIARLLTPADLGLAAEAIVFSSFAFLVADVGLGAVLIQREELSREDQYTVFWTNTVTGVVLAGALVGLSGPISALYGEPRVASLLAVLSLSVVFTALGLTPGALLIRDFRFRSLELRSIVSAFFGAAAAVTVAALGYGPWAIIVQSLVSTGLSTALMWAIIGWRPRFVYSWKSFRGFAGFSGFVVGSGLLGYLSRNADNFLIGRYIGVAKLGAYSLAYNVMLVPVRTALVVQNVIFPAMSKIREPKLVAQVWIRVTRLVASLSVPAYLGMVVVAPDLVRVVYGHRWADAIPVLQILAYVGMLQSWGSTRGSVFLALDRASLLFRLNAVGTALAVTSFIVGLHWGIVGVAAGYAVATTIGNVYGTLLAVRVAQVTFVQFMRSIAGVLEAGALMAVVVLGARLLLLHEGVPQAARLAILVVLGVAIYIPVCFWWAPEVLRDLDESWQQLRKRGEAVGEVVRSAAV